MKASKESATQADIISTLAETTDMSKADVTKLLKAQGELMESHLIKNGSGSFAPPFLGVKFNRVKRAGRKGRNPQTGEEIKIKSRNVVTTKVLKGLKDAVA